ncbi:hypothetical protein RchiOBHm_Chr4g0396641 [Rosa chinensis]|uniref:Uncharacterized protein n=1 Tax=Rosa chinensis TaxID=74649 RepID=A0A2P6QRV1_ROSCH|nr:hypothetical protein RchiOBHm_Chr4g0396641 [Rosa chinensis]
MDSSPPPYHACGSCLRRFGRKCGDRRQHFYCSKLVNVDFRPPSVINPGPLEAP